MFEVRLTWASALREASEREVFGATPAEVTKTAEIDIEQHLGLIGDPILGLLQTPCIERNAMDAIKAVNAARLARHSEGLVVNLDPAIETMRITGKDTAQEYNEASRSGLAVAATLC